MEGGGGGVVEAQGGDRHHVHMHLGGKACVGCQFLLLNSFNRLCPVWDTTIMCISQLLC